MSVTFIGNRPSRSIQSAFTLVELLVVIIIIAILAAILFPVFANAREKGRAAACISNAKQIGTGILGYVQDYDEVMPYGFNTSGCTADSTPYPDCHNPEPAIWGAVGISWPSYIAPYIAKQNAQNGGRYYTQQGVFFCPDVPNRYNGNYSPLMTFLANKNGGSTSSGAGSYGLLATYGVNSNVQNPMPVSKIIRPSELLLLTENWTVSPCATTTVVNRTRPTIFSSCALNLTPPGAYDRHYGGATCIFVDGHVKWLIDATIRANPNDMWSTASL